MNLISSSVIGLPINIVNIITIEDFLESIHLTSYHNTPSLYQLFETLFLEYLGFERESLFDLTLRGIFNIT